MKESLLKIDLMKGWEESHPADKFVKPIVHNFTILQHSRMLSAALKKSNDSRMRRVSTGAAAINGMIACLKWKSSVLKVPTFLYGLV
jgi:hypothetical protein